MYLIENQKMTSPIKREKIKNTEAWGCNYITVLILNYLSYFWQYIKLSKIFNSEIFNSERVQLLFVTSCYFLNHPEHPKKY